MSNMVEEGKILVTLGKNKTLLLYYYTSVSIYLVVDSSTSSSSIAGMITLGTDVSETHNIQINRGSSI